MKFLYILPFFLKSSFSFKAVVIGGGPTGKLSAISLAEKGFDVSIFEKKEKPNIDQKSFNFIISKRGLDILKDFNISLEDSVDVKNLINHSIKDKPLIVKSPESISIDRSDLLKAMDERLKSLGVFTEKSEFEAADFGNKIAYLSHGSERYDLLVGADGSNSQVRTQLADTYPDDMFISQKIDDRLYKTIKLDPFGFAYLEGYEKSWDDSFHVWNSEHCDLICPPTKENGLTGTFVSSNNDFSSRNFDAVFSRMKSETIMEFDRQHPKRQRTITSSYIGLDSVVLVGDSAHSVLASIGQGVNCGIESVGVLKHCLNFKEDEISFHYNRLRLADSHAVCKLSQMGFGGNSDRSNRGNSLNFMEYINDPSLSYSEILKFVEHNV